MGGLGFFLIWQGTLAVFPSLNISRIRIWASSGMHAEFSKFYYFYHHLDLFPVATELNNSELPDSQQGARKFVEEKPETLVMDIKHTIRSGDLGKIFLLIPNSWVGSVKTPTIHWFTAPLHILSLLALFFAFWRERKTKLGFFVVYFLGCTTFISYEAYRNENVFSIAVSISILLLALHFPLVKAREMGFAKVLALAIFSGLLLGFMKHVRTEIVLTAVGLLPLYLINKKVSWYANALVSVFFVAALFYGNRATGNHIDAKYAQAKAFLTQVGGHPFEGPRHLTHNFWHAVYCGLGDFDWKFNYAWDDRAAADYAVPLIRSRYGVEPPIMEGCCASSEYHDEAKKYYKRPYEMPEYGLVMRAKVLKDISENPFWYLSVLAGRVYRALTSSTGVAPFFGLLAPIPAPLFLAIFVVAFLWRKREWFLIRLILFPLPLLGVALAVYSGRGTTYYVYSNVLAVGIAAFWLYELKLRPKWNRDILKVFDEPK